MSDPYVTAVWAAVSQQTRVIRSTCAPQYEETLYFPTNLVRINSHELEAKGDIVLYVLHHDKTAPIDIGFTRIPLAKITSAPVKRIEDSGTNVKTRCTKRGCVATAGRHTTRRARGRDQGAPLLHSRPPGRRHPAGADTLCA